MIIDFDPKKLHAQVVCGISEEHKPTEGMKQIAEKLAKLRKQLRKFQDDIVGPAITEIEALVKAENEKAQPKLKPKDK